jgi:uncharacterized secreted repeat protein (TIGR03808 family)
MPNAMRVDRRHFLKVGTGAAAGLAAARAVAAPSRTPNGLDASLFGLRPGSPDDQSRALQRAVDDTARTRTPLAMAPGVYRVGNIKLPSGTRIVGARGATRLMLAEGSSLFTTQGTEHVTLSGLDLDGQHRRPSERRGLIHAEQASHLRIVDCEITDAGGTAIHCVAVSGEIIDSVLTDNADVAIHSIDARELLIARNTISHAGNNGIQVWRSGPGPDGTIVADNRIEGIENRSGGSGQYGNAINVYLAHNVIVRGNQIRNCAFSAVRGNAASNIAITGNIITQVGEVALYAEFGFEGAMIANNTVDQAAIGIAVTNFNEGGRLGVVQGNLIRNLTVRRPAGTDPNDGAGIGIAVEADTAVTGNVVESAPFAGIVLGFGRFLRDVAATGNVVRRANIGIAVSVTNGAGSALIANNVISEFIRGAIMGMDHRAVVGDDLGKGGAEKYANLTISGNRAR